MPSGFRGGNQTIYELTVLLPFDAAEGKSVTSAQPGEYVHNRYHL